MPTRHLTKQPLTARQMLANVDTAKPFLNEIKSLRQDVSAIQTTPVKVGVLSDISPIVGHEAYVTTQPGRGIILDAAGAISSNAVTTTTHVEVLRVTIPAGTFKSYDFIQLWYQFLAQNNTGTNRNLNQEIVLGGTTLTTFTHTIRTDATDRRGDIFIRIRAQGATNSQAMQANLFSGSVGNEPAGFASSSTQGANILYEFGTASEDGTNNLDLVVNAYWSGGAGLGYNRAAYILWGPFISSVTP